MFQFISRLTDDPDPVIIIPFGGYANNDRIYGQARVLEDEGITHEEDDGFLKNLYNSYKRFESDEKEGVVVTVTANDFNTSLTSDAEGYVYLDEAFKTNSLDKEWHPIHYSLTYAGKPFTIKDEILKPLASAQYGIISDMDDTVIRTGISSAFKWKVIVNSFFTHTNQRMPLEGAQEFYQMLRKGISGQDDNPFFYLSNSPWNLYEYLAEFLNYQKFPKGVLLLRDMGLENKKKTSFKEENKYIKIVHLLETYPNLPFVLIGDAADIDHDIYMAIAKQFPNRIKAIYIRTVTDQNKMKDIKKRIEATTDINIQLISHTDEAVVHARANGFVR
ncbi:App1 family protein [Flavobacterium sp. ASW18X]|uniref:App1 family protein n=1 Tax=Flavobacterium sp. ASW18X TaxID=2572595 RepID=UPI0010AE2C7D|nr:phosphatase domain-containing protein [Flavobacterium sp. ASW18X]TKD66540.1 DUF2183 domain-containing protein [Flavobacterium sp. ASW18X]